MQCAECLQDEKQGHHTGALLSPSLTPHEQRDEHDPTEGDGACEAGQGVQFQRPGESARRQPGGEALMLVDGHEWEWDGEGARDQEPGVKSRPCAQGSQLGI
jgi:hypothetical protein